MRFVQQQFFPSSDRNELIVDWNLPQNSFDRRDQRADGPLRAGGARRAMTASTTGRPMSARARRASCCRSTSSRRTFVRPDRHRHQGPGGARAREGRASGLSREDLSGTDGCVKLLEIGPPVGRPVQYRRQRAGHRKGARACAGACRHHRRQPASRRPGLRLDGAGAGREGRRAAGQGPSARRHLGGHRLDLERGGRRHVGDAGARRHLSRQRDRPRRRRRARLDRDAAATCSCRATAASRCRSRRSPRSATSSSSR